MKAEIAVSLMIHYYLASTANIKSVGNKPNKLVLSTTILSWAVVAHVFNPSTWEAEAGGFLSSRPA
jgi:major histocompatibility complex class I